MSLPTIEPIQPSEEEPLPPARRRRQRRTIVPGDSSERAEYLRAMARRTVPSFDFFLFSGLAGVTLGAAMLLDAPALFVLAALLSPFMAPALGAALGTLAGTGRFILESLASLSIGSLIVFLCGAVAGWAATLLPAKTYAQANFYSHFSWPYFLVLGLGSALTAFLLARTPTQKPLVSSVAIAYGLYLPVGAAGFGMTSGAAGLWPDGLGLFAIHLLWAVVAVIITLFLAGLRPLNSAGYALSAGFSAAGLAVVLFLAQLGAFQNAALTGVPAPDETSMSISQAVTATGMPSETPEMVNSPSPPPSATATAEPSATFTPSSTPTRTLVPSRTPTITITPAPTPVWARISAEQGDGALVRESPDYGSDVVQSVLNGTLVEVLPQVSTNGGATWTRIRLVNNKEGWVVSGLLRTATPAPSD